ncbi:asparagine synthase (glutamine-hydrolyzing) [Streptomyces resistomycificus]|uniref:asparagine synthase (glutamine-hydrolyzing) n=1 Tax=Streptomyces resistomycificus TaxID=67356 RepID=A0A0L8L2Z1_9ACTN|nr:asparagine synthase (glutamine-hydrolyzing) [Streptomyces resistomycificus]KOG32603.1 asparagine synthase [Streptomyces resistomycificus]KUN90536.1 asparagine synthetase B [Streptomyces resistomycificus]
MCGIACIARLDGRELGPETDFVLREMADILDHRGPDDRELMREGPVGMAFTRLSLVDPAGGGQPLVSDDGSLVLIANGEVYNHRELAANLPRHARLRTGSDCEVLLHLYQQHGLDFLRDVRGMFGVILWDRKKGQLILARDRFGIKPLYYQRDRERIVLSSEIKGLYAEPATPSGFDWARSLSVAMLPASPRLAEPELCTWFEGVESVPAATVMRIDLRDGHTTRHRYWQLPTEQDESADARELTGRYGELLEASVAECATADTELGLFLSGGIDSGAVLALAAGRLDTLHTFTALSGGTHDNGDAHNAQWIARELGVPNHQVVFPPGHTPSPQEWLRLVWLTETPLCGPEAYYKHELHRFARQQRPHLRGMLLGAASDEFNGGYSRDLSGDGDWESFLGALTYLDHHTRLEQHPALARWWAGGESLIRLPALERGSAAASHDVYRAYVESEYRKVQQYNVWHEDRTAAGSGIEARVPFLDHRLVELVTSVPHRLRPSLLWDKRILRDAMRGRMPARIAERPKGPFFYGTGTRHAYRMIVGMLRADGHHLVERALSAPGADDFIDADVLRRRLAALGDGDTDSPDVEIILRVVNMGLLAEMAAKPPRLEDLPTGPPPSSLQGPPADHVQLFSPRRDVDTSGVLRLADDTMLLTDEAGAWFLLREGQIEYVFDQDTPILRLLRHLDGQAPLSGALRAAAADLDEVRTEMDELLTQRLLGWAS